MRCLATPPDLDSDLIMDCHLERFAELCVGIFLLLGSLAANKEEIRCKVSSEREMMKSLAKALSSDNLQVKMAASRYVHC